MTVKEVSALTGVSVRALHHYDRVGLLRPAAVSGAGYRLYDEDSLERLQLILLYRELEFSLGEIRAILDSPAFERNRALEQQVKLLEMKREHLDNVIDLAKGLLLIGVRNLDFKAFDTRKLDEYAAEAKANWGTSAEYREYEQRSAGRSRDEEQRIAEDFMALFSEFGKLVGQDPAGEVAQALVARLQGFVTDNWYTCSDAVLLSLGRMYTGDGRMGERIDRAGGPGTAQFARAAIEAYCGRRGAKA